MTLYFVSLFYLGLFLSQINELLSITTKKPIILKHLFILLSKCSFILLSNTTKKPIILKHLFILLSKCSLKLSRSSRISPTKCFCDEIVSTLLLLNILERELSLLVLFQK